VRELAVPVVPTVRAVRAGAVRAVLATTSMWQRGGCNNVAVTSTWLGAAAGTPKRHPHGNQPALTPQEPHPRHIVPVAMPEQLTAPGWWTGQVWLEKVMRLLQQPGPGILNRVRA
jgi:hypothetical protein